MIVVGEETAQPNGRKTKDSPITVLEPADEKVAKKLGLIPTTRSSDVGGRPAEEGFAEWPGFKENAPLWFCILQEAEGCEGSGWRR